MLGEFAQGEYDLDRAIGKALGLSLTVVIGNGCLMALLSANPFAHPTAQLLAGAFAMGLHGWGAWEIGSAMAKWGSASGAMAQRAAKELAWEAGRMAKIFKKKHSVTAGSSQEQEQEQEPGQGGA